MTKQFPLLSIILFFLGAIALPAGSRCVPMNEDTKDLANRAHASQTFLSSQVAITELNPSVPVQPETPQGGVLLGIDNSFCEAVSIVISVDKGENGSREMTIQPGWYQQSYVILAISSRRWRAVSHRSQSTVTR